MIDRVKVKTMSWGALLSTSDLTNSQALLVKSDVVKKPNIEGNVEKAKKLVGISVFFSENEIIMD